MRRVLAITLAALVAGCATDQPGAGRVADGKKQIAQSAVCCKNLDEARRLPLPVEKAALPVDGSLQVFDFGAGKSFFVMYELPVFVRTYSIDVTSIPGGPITDMAIFIPRVTLYDAEFKITRHFDEKTLRNRGNQLERTVFINPPNASERYLVISGSDLSSSIETPYSMVTSTPIVAGPVVFNLVSGHDGKTTLRAAPTGNLQIEVQGHPAAAAKGSSKP